ncbi:MAG TPA: putative sugar nucleotidyl transferase [Longimicrobiales bacterium]|nr:putative sugar nucleotidyl transferase [Longimicrobiales bacterium]
MDDALILFDDDVARDWFPFCLTRPAGELRFGTMTLRQRAERWFGMRCAGYMAAPHLQAFDEPWAPPVLQDVPPHGAGTLFLSSRTVLAEPGPDDARVGPEPHLIAVAGMVCGWYAPAGTPLPGDDFFRDPVAHTPRMPVRELPGRLFRHPWQLIIDNVERIAADAAWLHPDAPRPDLPHGVHVLGDGAVLLGRNVALEPGTVLDASRGPIWLEDHVVVRAFSRLAGPVHVAPGSALLGGSYEGVSIGPVCRVRGEVGESIFLGYANKSHEGFLGHALVGMWANLGALTTNSDLKNNYGTVRMWTPAGPVDTGAVKLGALVGDHVKTAIGTLLTTGTVIGPGANLFGGAPPGYVPPFAWGGRDTGSWYDIDRFLATAAVVMQRRNVALSDDARTLLRAAHDEAVRRGWIAGP